MRNRRLLSLLEVKVPNVAIHQCDDERGAEKHDGRADVIPPVCVESVGRDGRIESEGQTEKAKENPEAYAGATLQEPPDCERHKKCRDEHDHREGRFLCLQQSSEHRRDAMSLPRGRRSDKRCSCRCPRRQIFSDLPRHFCRPGRGSYNMSILPAAVTAIRASSSQARPADE